MASMILMTMIADILMAMMTLLKMVYEAKVTTMAMMMMTVDKVLMVSMMISMMISMVISMTNAMRGTGVLAAHSLYRYLSQEFSHA